MKEPIENRKGYCYTALKVLEKKYGIFDMSSEGIVLATMELSNRRDEAACFFVPVPPSRDDYMKVGVHGEEVLIKEMVDYVDGCCTMPEGGNRYYMITEEPKDFIEVGFLEYQDEYEPREGALGVSFHRINFVRFGGKTVQKAREVTNLNMLFSSPNGYVKIEENPELGEVYTQITGNQ